jgi:hypothetical protein
MYSRVARLFEDPQQLYRKRVQVLSHLSFLE